MISLAFIFGLRLENMENAAQNVSTRVLRDRSLIMRDRMNTAEERSTTFALERRIAPTEDPHWDTAEEIFQL